MSIFTSGVEIPKVYSSGIDATRVMLGTGSEAVEVWPGFYDVSYTFNFPNQDELKWAPITGFDGRTSGGSLFAPSFIFNDMLVAGDNPQPTYYTRLIDRQLDGDEITYEVVMGDAMNTKDKPSYLVLGSNIIFTRMLVLEFGSNGTALRTVINGTATGAYQYSTTYARDDKLTLVWKRPTDQFMIYKNNSLVGTHQTSYAEFKTVNGRMYPGFGLYSTGSTWSTRLQSVKISGKTSYKTVLAASDFLSKITVGNAIQTVVAKCVIHTGGVTDLMLTGAGWAQPSSSGLRTFRILVNNVVKATTQDEAGFLHVPNVTLPPNSEVTVQAYSASTNASYRNVTSGVLQIGDPTLPT